MKPSMELIRGCDGNYNVAAREYLADGCMKEYHM